MRKNDLVAAVANHADLDNRKASDTVDIILEEITNALSRDDAVSLPGFGSFLRRLRSARRGRNPASGETITIPASNNIAFRPGKQLKQAVNP